MYHFRLIVILYEWTKINLQDMLLLTCPVFVLNDGLFNITYYIDIYWSIRMALPLLVVVWIKTSLNQRTLNKGCCYWSNDVK